MQTNFVIFLAFQCPKTVCLKQIKLHYDLDLFWNFSAQRAFFLGGGGSTIAILVMNCLASHCLIYKRNYGIFRCKTSAISLIQVVVTLHDHTDNARLIHSATKACLVMQTNYDTVTY